MELLVSLVDNLVEAGWKHRELHLFGFSQGGCATLELLVRFKGARRLGG